MRNGVVVSVLCVAVLLLNGCASTKIKKEGEERPLLGNPEYPYEPEREPELGDILHMPTGLFVDQEQMLEAAIDNRMVYVGETHDNPAAHRFQLEVLKAMALRYPGEVALGMEVFIPSQQEALDKWVAGELDEPAFLRSANWYKIWRSDFAYYRELLEFARDNNIPVRGLNASKALVRAVGSNPVEKLAEEHREQLPDMSFIDDYQQAMVEAVFEGHGPGGSNHAEGFKRVQTLWDQTMAENIVNYLDSDEGKGKRMMVVSGGHHVRFGYGIPRRVFRLMPSSYTILGTREIVVPEEKKHQVMDITLPRFPMVPYDYVKHVVYETLPEQGMKLGVMFDYSGESLTILKVLPDSNAEAAALQTGDLVTHLDGVAMADMYDIKYALQSKKKGEMADITVKREDQVLQLELIFSK